MEKKEEYEELKFDIVFFEDLDVIRCSTVGDGGDDGWTDPNTSAVGNF